jgi:hypothetical protein
MEGKPMTLYIYSTGEAVRDLTDAEATHYMVSIAADSSHTGAVDGSPYGLAGVTVYAI